MILVIMLRIILFIVGASVLCKDVSHDISLVGKNFSRLSVTLRFSATLTSWRSLTERLARWHLASQYLSTYICQNDSYRSSFLK